jgi:hypothetical protein
MIVDNIFVKGDFGLNRLYHFIAGNREQEIENWQED